MNRERVKFQSIIYVLGFKWFTQLVWIAFLSLTIPIRGIYILGAAGNNHFCRYAPLVLEGQPALVFGSHDLAGATQRRD
jgi:hypothetical protein